MKQKPLDLLTMDTIRLDHYYTEDSGKPRANLIGAFGGVYREYYYKQSANAPEIGTDSYVTPKLNRTVKTLGTSIELNVIGYLKEVNSHSTLPEIAKKYPKVAEAIKKNYVKGWLEQYNQVLIDNRDKYIKSVEKLYSEMVQIHTELGYKSDLATLAELDDLLYCEAEGFLSKMEEKINKKNNPKNLKLYKALQTLRSKPIISCESA